MIELSICLWTEPIHILNITNIGMVALEFQFLKIEPIWFLKIKQHEFFICKNLVDYSRKFFPKLQNPLVFKFQRPRQEIEISSSLLLLSGNNCADVLEYKSPRTDLIVEWLCCTFSAKLYPIQFLVPSWLWILPVFVESNETILGRQCVHCGLWFFIQGTSYTIRELYF